MHKMTLKIICKVLLCSLFLVVFVLNSVWAARLPSRARVIGTQLILEKRQSNGALGPANPYIIKGVTWQPATVAPAKGANPYQPRKLMNYGFFVDEPGRVPPGAEVLKYWLDTKAKTYFRYDVPLMKAMNVNTVRLYSHLSDNPAITNAILDYLYHKGIMAVMTVGDSRQDFESQDVGYIYTDYGEINSFIPSGWMGDLGALTFNDQYTNQPYSGAECIQIKYSAYRSHGKGWAGIYWQWPENNWGTGTSRGWDLRDFNKLVFYAKGETGKEVISKFKVGGITNDSADVTLHNVKLTNYWKEYSIDLSKYNLADIAGGFCIVFNGKAKTVYLDEIKFVYDPNLGPRKYEKIVSLYKNHPAILMWSLGNEWNLPNNLLHGYGSVSEAAAAINTAALRIKMLDPEHPVTSSIGDRFYDADYTNTIDYVVRNCPNVDVWGLNVYRAFTFSGLFNQWQQVTLKPFYLSEFGTDSFKVNAGGFTVLNGYQAAGCRGVEDQDMQANFDLSEWDEIKNNLSAFSNAKMCLGGFVHEFNDELWKVGNPNLGLLGLNKNSHSYNEYDLDGYFVDGGHPDHVANEEYFGLVNAKRKPKKAYDVLKAAFGKIVAPTDLVATAISRSQIGLTWKDNSDNETKFLVELATKANGPFRSYRLLNADTTFLVSARLRHGTTYYYRVKAYNNIDTVYTNVASATTLR